MLVEIEPLLIRQRPDSSPSSAPLGSEIVVEYVDNIEKVPDDFLIATLGDRRLRVVEPFGVAITRENLDFIATALEIDEFGFGETRQEAIRDLQQAIVELYLSLKRNEERLGPDLAATLKTLSTKVVPVHLA